MQLGPKVVGLHWVQEAAPGSGRPLKRLRRGTERSCGPTPGAKQPLSLPPAEEDTALASDQAGRQKRARQAPAVWQAQGASPDEQRQAGRHGSGRQPPVPASTAGSPALSRPRSAKLQQLRRLSLESRAARVLQPHSHSAAHQPPHQPQSHSHSNGYLGHQQQPSRPATREEEDVIDDNSDGDFEAAAPRGGLQHEQQARQGPNPFARVRAGNFKVCASA